MPCWEHFLLGQPNLCKPSMTFLHKGELLGTSILLYLYWCNKVDTIGMPLASESVCGEDVTQAGLMPIGFPICYNVGAGRAVAASSEGEESPGSIGHDDG